MATGHATGPNEEDTAMVARFIDAHREAQAAIRRAAQARDDVAQVYLTVRKVDREAEAAQARLGKVAAAQAAAVERAELFGQLHDAVARRCRDRELSRGRGPRSRSARARLAASAYEAPALRDRLRELDERVAELSTAVGSSDPEDWAAMRAYDEAVLAEHRRRREVETERAGLLYPLALSRQQAAQVAAQAALDQCEAAAADLVRRGIDPDEVVNSLRH